MLGVLFTLAVLTWTGFTYIDAWHESFRSGATSTVLIWYGLWVLVLKRELRRRRKAFQRLE